MNDYKQHLIKVRSQQCRVACVRGPGFLFDHNDPVPGPWLHPALNLPFLYTEPEVTPEVLSSVLLPSNFLLSLE